MLKGKSCANLLRLCLQGQPGWWNPIKWPKRSQLWAWEKTQKKTEICDDLGSIQYMKRNKWEKIEGNMKLEGALPTAGSKEIKTGDRADVARSQACAPSWFYQGNTPPRPASGGAQVFSLWMKVLVSDPCANQPSEMQTGRPEMALIHLTISGREAESKEMSLSITRGWILSSHHLRSQVLADSRGPWHSNSPHCIIKEGTSFSGWSALLSLIWFPSSAHSMLQAPEAHATTTTLRGNWF